MKTDVLGMKKLVLMKRLLLILKMRIHTFGMKIFINQIIHKDGFKYNLERINEKV